MKRRKPNKQKVTISAQMPISLVERMKQEVEEKGIGQSQIIRWALCERYGLPLGIR